jgi:hypothetical protein
MATELTTGVGRIVWGHPCESRDKTQKDHATGKFLPVLKDGVKVQQWTFGVAFPRAEFESTIWPAMAAEAATVYPGGQVPPKFAWKFKDGDRDIDDDGKPYNLREGYAGHIVLTVGTELKCPEVFKFNGTGYDQLPGDAIKCGDYVVLGLNLKANAPTDRTMTPGMFVNPTVIEFVGYGTKIIPQGGVNPMDVLGGRQRYGHTSGYTRRTWYAGCYGHATSHGGTCYPPARPHGTACRASAATGTYGTPSAPGSAAPDRSGLYPRCGHTRRAVVYQWRLATRRVGTACRASATPST